MLTESLRDGLATDVAMIVTEPPEGAAGGAVYALGKSLAVCVGLKVPHDPAGMQVHFTPPGAAS
jgi:hypothetical protein